MKNNKKLILLCTLLIIMLTLFFTLIFSISSDMASNYALPESKNNSAFSPGKPGETEPWPDAQSPMAKPSEIRNPVDKNGEPEVQSANPGDPSQKTLPEKSKSPSPPPESESNVLPAGFVYISEFIPDARLEIRYATTHNFTGRVVAGYLSDHASLTVKAAEALNKASEILEKEGYGIRIYDAYRPRQAVQFFVKWAEEPEDGKTKAEFYPDYGKKDLFSLGYIARKSGHSRGSTVDLTIFSLKTGEDLDMGSSFDFLGPVSNHGTEMITEKQSENRNILKKAMTGAGFKAQKTEWWHYTLANEPYPDTYFDFPVN